MAKFLISINRRTLRANSALRWKRGLIASLSLGAACSFFTGCSVNPVTGEKQFSLLSQSQEIAMGEQNYLPAQQQQGGAYTIDPKVTQYVSRVGKKLASHSAAPNLPYEFVVLNNDVPNAWAMPGGKIAINRGLLVLLKDEAQLAAVLSHEVVHAAARHGAQQMTQQQVLGLGTAAVGIAAANTEYAEWIGLGSSVGAAAWGARYGRQQELDSDRYGIEYMVSAGYEPRAAVELQETFVSLSQGQKANAFSALFASHPPSQLRVDRNKKRVENLPSGLRNRSAYQNALSQILKDQSAYQTHQLAQASMSKKNFTRALQQVDSAIKTQPKEALFYVTKGHILRAKNNTEAAKTAFQQAANRNPNYFMGPLGLGLSLKELGKNTQAKAPLLKSFMLLRTPIAAFHLGELELSKGAKDKALDYFQFAAQDSGDVGKAAQAHLLKLQPPAASVAQ